MTVKNSQILNYSFSKNKGSGASLNFYNMFEENQINIGQLLLENVKTIQIIGCTFDIDSQSKSSIYYLNNIFGSEIELIDCAFFGKTSKNTHYIDGKLLDKESPRIKINEGVFESQKQLVFNLKLMKMKI